ncbi:MAG: hypothetical protein A3E83_04240 [Gammaproteobacteria bacterium RIFCSPHIGHO2_12_FULL_41_20]|nr:MAG: hypothetical protein A3E83_04240 [Gammaproteobacteria bacterium RIFCSPHIGHO2_12_FULL_41_20]
MSKNGRKRRERRERAEARKIAQQQTQQEQSESPQSSEESIESLLQDTRKPEEMASSAYDIKVIITPPPVAASIDDDAFNLHSGWSPPPTPTYTDYYPRDDRDEKLWEELVFGRQQIPSVDNTSIQSPPTLPPGNRVSLSPWPLSPVSSSTVSIASSLSSTTQQRSRREEELAERSMAPSPSSSTTVETQDAATQTTTHHVATTRHSPSYAEVTQAARMLRQYKAFLENTRRSAEELLEKTMPSLRRNGC